ncbi:MAG: acyl-CoA thioesterase [Elusimicrobiota bacterium]|jgi:acyl-CoA thioester hydrolase|nr:acyl-CoA thioesterase [Elusimicrobiota bacterium]
MCYQINPKTGHSRKSDSINVRISYADTDQMGVVYYANYFMFFEKGRTEWLRSKGLEYKTFERNGFYFPVVFAECKCISPARYDDVIAVETKLTELFGASFVFSYEIKIGDKIIALGKTKYPFVDNSLKPVWFPEKYKNFIGKRT